MRWTQKLAFILLTLLYLVAVECELHAQQQISYFLIDKSGSMEEKRSKWDQSIVPGSQDDIQLLQAVKERVKNLLKENPPLPGVHEVYIRTFDTKVFNNIDPKNYEEVEKHLKNIRPGGRTVIGEQLADVSEEIKKRDIPTFVYLFTDMMEFPPDLYTPRVTKAEGISRLSEEMMQRQKDKNGGLYQFTWGDHSAIEKFPGAKPLSIWNPFMVTPFLKEVAPISTFAITETDGEFIGTESQHVCIEGKITTGESKSLQEIANKLRPSLKISSAEFGDLTINGKQCFSIPARAFQADGTFLLKDLELEFADLDKLFGKDHNSTPPINKEYNLVLSLEFLTLPQSIDGIEGANLISCAPLTRSFTFGSIPSLGFASWKKDNEKLFKTTLGDKIQVPLKLSWNRQAIGYRASIDVEGIKNEVVIQYAKTNEPIVQPITLNETGSLDLVAHIQESETCQAAFHLKMNGKVAQTRWAQLDFSEKRVVVKTPEEDTLSQFLSCEKSYLRNSSGEISCLELSSKPSNAKLGLELHASVPPGLHLSLINSYDHTKEIPIGQGVQNITIEGFREEVFYMHGMAEHAGSYSVELVFIPITKDVKFEDKNNDNKICQSPFSTPLTVIVSQPSWSITGSDSNKEMEFSTSSVNISPLLFHTSGDAISSTEARFNKLRNPVTFKAQVTPKGAEHSDMTIYASYCSAVADEKDGFLESVIFEASGKNTISLEKFVRNPNFKILLKEGAKPSGWGFKWQESGKVILGPAANQRNLRECDSLPFIQIPIKANLQK